MPRRTKVGKVVSDKNAKTIIVEVHRRKQHPVYRKYIQERKRFMAHDENEAAQVGDIVRIIESRPMSAHKHWALDEVLTKGVGPKSRCATRKTWRSRSAGKRPLPKSR